MPRKPPVIRIRCSTTDSTGGFLILQHGLARTSQRERRHAAREGGQVEYFALKGDSQTAKKVVACAIIALGALAALRVASAESDTASTVGSIVALGVMIVGVFMFDTADDSVGVELNEVGMIVRRSYDRPREWRIAWEQVDHVAITHRDSEERVVVAVLRPGSGFVSGMPKERCSSRDGGYLMCDLREVEPSEEAFLEALRRYSGTDVRS